MATATSAGEAGTGTTVILQQEEKVVSTERKKIKVMVALDDSDSSYYALTWALDHLFVTSVGVGAAAAKAFPEEVDTVYLVHVQQPFHHYAYPVGPGSTGLYTARLVRRIVSNILFILIAKVFLFVNLFIINSTAVYGTSAVVESVRKAQEESSTALLSRALNMCKEKLVSWVLLVCG